MKEIRGRKEIAKAINFGKYPVVTIDLARSTEYGLQSNYVRLHMGQFQTGEEWFEKATINAYSDEKKLTISSSDVCCLSNEFTFADLMDDIERAQAPVIEPESEVLVAVINSIRKEAYSLMIVKTGKINRHCSTPMAIEPVDMSRFF